MGNEDRFTVNQTGGRPYYDGHNKVSTNRGKTWTNGDGVLRKNHSHFQASGRNLSIKRGMLEVSGEGPINSVKAIDYLGRRVNVVVVGAESFRIEATGAVLIRVDFGDGSTVVKKAFLSK